MISAQRGQNRDGDPGGRDRGGERESTRARARAYATTSSKLKDFVSDDRQTNRRL